MFLAFLSVRVKVQHLLCIPTHQRWKNQKPLLLLCKLQGLKIRWITFLVRTTAPTLPDQNTFFFYHTWKNLKKVAEKRDISRGEEIFTLLCLGILKSADLSHKWAISCNASSRLFSLPHSNCSNKPCLLALWLNIWWTKTEKSQRKKQKNLINKSICHEMVWKSENQKIKITVGIYWFIKCYKLGIYVLICSVIIYFCITSPIYFFQLLLLIYELFHFYLTYLIYVFSPLLFSPHILLQYRYKYTLIK